MEISHFLHNTTYLFHGGGHLPPIGVYGYPGFTFIVFGCPCTCVCVQKVDSASLDYAPDRPPELTVSLVCFIEDTLAGWLIIKEAVMNV
jgi:hypothetical protein